MARETIDWKARALAAEERAERAETELAQLRGRLGRPQAAARTPDGELIARAMAALSCSQGELTRRLSAKLGRPVGQAQLSRANKPPPPDDTGRPLGEDYRTALKELIAAASAG